jgi:hypothetical protein
MEIELKTTSLSEIIRKCDTLKWDVKDTKIVSKIFEDIRRPDEYYVRLYLKHK